MKGHYCDKADSVAVLLRRSSSPSEKMAALSRQLTSAGIPNLSVGTPQLNRESALSRKAKSELNFTNLRNTDPSHATSGAIDSTPLRTTRNIAGRATLQIDQLAKSSLERHAFIAPKELDILVACRRGLKVPKFVNGLMTLLTSAVLENYVVESTAHDS